MKDKIIVILLAIALVTCASAQETDDTGVPINPVVKDISDIREDISDLKTEFVNIQQTINSQNQQLDELFQENFGRIVIAIFALFLISESVQYLFSSYKKRKIWEMVRNSREEKESKILKAYNEQKKATEGLGKAMLLLTERLSMTEKTIATLHIEMQSVVTEAVKVKEIKTAIQTINSSKIIAEKPKPVKPKRRSLWNKLFGKKTSVSKTKPKKRSFLQRILLKKPAKIPETPKKEQKTLGKTVQNTKVVVVEPEKIAIEDPQKPSRIPYKEATILTKANGFLKVKSLMKEKGYIYTDGIFINKEVEK